MLHMFKKCSKCHKLLCHSMFGNCIKSCSQQCVSCRYGQHNTHIFVEKLKNMCAHQQIPFEIEYRDSNYNYNMNSIITPKNPNHRGLSFIEVENAMKLITHNKKQKKCKQNNLKYIPLCEITENKRTNDAYMYLRPKAFKYQNSLHILKIDKYKFVFYRISMRMISKIKQKQKQLHETALINAYCRICTMEKQIINTYEQDLNKNKLWQQLIAKCRKKVYDYNKKNKEWDKLNKLKCISCNAERVHTITKTKEECAKCDNGWNCGSNCSYIKTSHWYRCSVCENYYEHTDLPRKYVKRIYFGTFVHRLYPIYTKKISNARLMLNLNKEPVCKSM